ncbi:ATP-binding protein [Umezawaea beigongshangensis]|uniref:ATP-binding protein n=1 Tax=Umezawaea beigongshangensis TaxID=2780383 RepID=UPI0018F274B2|nr:ATP-binding protein [Umezawaea beigongshangensis]
MSHSSRATSGTPLARTARNVVPPDGIEIRLRATPAHVRLIRRVTAVVARRADLGVDDVADLALAVDGACSLLVERAVEGADLLCRCWADVRGVHFSAEVSARTSRVPDPRSFGWRLVRAMTTTATSWVEPVRAAGHPLHVELWRRTAAP